MSSAVSTRPAFTSAELTQLRAMNLPDTDGKPMDSPRQRIAMALLIDSASHCFRRRKTGYIGGNMCMYYSLVQSLKLDFLGPNFFYVKEADPFKERTKWEVWNENNQFPDVIIELLSPTTTANDLGKKKKIYEQTFQTPEYFVFDLTDNTLLGWRLSPLTNAYEPIEPEENGRMFSEELDLWLGTWHGTVERKSALWLRLYHADGSLVQRAEEEERREKLAERRERFAERREKLAERTEKEAAQRLAAAESAAKEDERAAKEVERAAKEVALAEIARLQKLLASAAADPNNLP